MNLFETNRGALSHCLMHKPERMIVVKSVAKKTYNSRSNISVCRAKNKIAENKSWIPKINKAMPENNSSMA